LEVSEAVCLALEDFPFGVEAFGDAVVTNEGPHVGDFFKAAKKLLAIPLLIL
jgi:hypothetical protein